jgi:hypothetical protein
VEHLKEASHLGRLMAMPTNIMLGWKGLPETNAPAYYSYIAESKCFTTLAPMLQFSAKAFLVTIFGTRGQHGSWLCFKVCLN